MGRIGLFCPGAEQSAPGILAHNGETSEKVAIPWQVTARNTGNAVTTEESPRASTRCKDLPRKQGICITRQHSTKIRPNFPKFLCGVTRTVIHAHRLRRIMPPNSAPNFFSPSPSTDGSRAKLSWSWPHQKHSPQESKAGNFTEKQKEKKLFTTDWGNE